MLGKQSNPLPDHDQVGGFAEGSRLVADRSEVARGVVVAMGS